MNQGRIIVITGAPGTGKTTTASVVAKESDLEKSVHMHTDDFYHYLSKGAIHEQKYKICNCRWHCRTVVFRAVAQHCSRAL